MPKNADSFFKKATTHPICQDYATHGTIEGAYGIIADGCGSAIDTDIGARLLAKATESEIYRNHNQTGILASVILAKARMSAEMLHLENESLYSTLFMMQQTDRGDIQVRAFGDGTIAAKTYEGELEIIDISFSSGAPCYLHYENNLANKRKYIEEYGGIKTINSWARKNGIWESEDHTKKVGLDSIDYYFHCFSGKHYQCVAIMSDGVQQFVRPVQSKTSKTTEKVDMFEVVEAFLNFKPEPKPNFNGEFVHRKATRVFRDHPEWQNLDDFSIAVIGGNYE